MRCLVTLVLLCLGSAGMAFETRVVTDHFDRQVEVPADPQRIVSLDVIGATAILADLRVPFIASVASLDTDTSEYYLPAMSASYGMTLKGDNITPIPIANPFDIELIASLDPDLILATARTYEQVDLLGAVAPTVFLNETPHPWEYQEAVANAVNQMEAFERRKQDYEDRVAKIKRYIDLPEGATYTIFEATEQGLLVRELFGVNHVAEDLGLVRNPSMQQIEDDNLFWVQLLSWEQLPEMEADFVFVPFTDQGWSNLEDQLRLLDANIPNWCNFLPACKEGRMIFFSRETTASPTFLHLHDTLSLITNEAVNRRFTGRNGLPGRE
ncbi:MAG: ABC transporter substrate-binding protein [Pseudomonadota bacterium]